MQAASRPRTWIWPVVLLSTLCCGRTQSTPLQVFDGARAFQDLLELVEIGPRPAGSEGAARARSLIAQRLRQAGWRVERHEFKAALPDGGELDMTNVIGIREGARRDQRILLVTHYDTKRLEGERFLGANDGASGAALLLELARQLAARPLAFTVWLVFFDGEEAFGPRISDWDGLYGSRALVDRMVEEGTFDEIGALVLVDMVADRDLNLVVDRSSSPALRAILRQEAEALGLEELIDPQVAVRVVDDHTPFLVSGVEEVLAVIDFQFGARRTPGPYWHTVRDNTSAVAAESLNSVGRLVVQTFLRIERRLLQRASAP